MTPFVWTDATPTAPGDYRIRQGSMVRFINVFESHGTLFVTLDDGIMPLSFITGQFAGPISMPVEPKEEEK